MGRAVALVAAVFLWGGCGSADRAGEDASRAGGAPGAEGFAAGEDGRPGRWRPVPEVRRPLSAPDTPVERGVGVVYIPPDPWDAEDADDTLVVREAPTNDAAPAALLVRDSMFTFHLLVPAGGPPPDGLALEFGYEELGLPADAPPRPDGWTPVIYADAGGDTLTGWARVDEREAGWIGWEAQLRGLPLFFAVPADSIGFVSEPEGGARSIPLDLDDYILHPLEARGPWLRVEVVTPSDYCFDPAAPARDTAWVRYLTDAGRPRLWYYTRGC